MSVGPWDIDAIVREVLRRLEQLASQSRMEPPPAALVPAAARPERGELRLADRVVTLATLDGRLRGIHRLVVGRRAVITPSVRDLLRKQEIALLREEPARPTGASPVSLAIIAAEIDYDPSRLSSRLAASATSAASVQAAVVQAAESVRDRRVLTVLLTERTALAACLANRHRALRAALAWSRESVREATRAIGANLLVLNPARQTDEELAGLIAEFQQDAPHACPSELQG